jgi:hypothetical protein
MNEADIDRVCRTHGEEMRNAYNMAVGRYFFGDEQENRIKFISKEACLTNFVTHQNRNSESI